MKEFSYFNLSKSQQNIINVEKTFTHSSINNICTTLVIKGMIDFECLSECINEFIKKDCSLRIQLTHQDNQIVQYYAEYKPYTFPIFDFKYGDEEGLDYWFHTKSQEVMDIYDRPLFTFYLYRLSQREGGLLIKIHHVISDGYSQALLCNRIAQLYLHRIKHEDVDVEVIPGYHEHLELEQKYLSSRRYQRDYDYWQKQLQKLEEVVSLKDKEHASLSTVGKRISYSLTEKQNNFIYYYCQQNRISPFSLFYMILAIWVLRMKKVKTFSIGVPILNRSTHEEKQMSGMFVSTVPFIFTIDEQWTFKELIEHVSDAWFDLLRHQKFPFEDISKIAKQLHPGMTSLFHFAFSYQNSQSFENEDTRFVFLGKWNYSGYQAQELCIHLCNREDIKKYTIDYDYLVQLFSEKEIRQLHESLMKILNEAILHPHTPIYELPVLIDSIEEQVIYQFPIPTQKQYIRLTPHDLFKDIVYKFPNRVSLISNGQRMTYTDLYNSALRLSGFYLEKVGTQKIIALELPRNESLIISMIGCLLSNNAWLIIDPHIPNKRKENILHKSQANLLISQNEWSDQIDIPAYTYSNIDSSPKDVEQTLDDLAYIVYTSGTSGEPKGVRILNKSLMNLTMAMESMYGRGGVLSLCAQGFDAFVLETIIALLNGRTVIMANEREMNDPKQIAQLIINFDVSFISITPSRLQAYLYQQQFCNAIEKLETIICGGEAYPPKLLDRIQLYTQARLINQYGPSEATIAVSYAELNQAHYIHVGKPMPGCKIYILDEHLKPLPIGVIGEVFISGVCLSDGYHQDKELTNQFFIDNPYSLDEKMYCTKDSGYWSQDGYLVITGRLDSQVKIRGYRIELGEISSQLLQHPSVHGATSRVINVFDKPIIISYYVSSDEIHDLKAYLGQYLPHYMIPQYIYHLDELPLTMNGKIDESKLPLPQVSDNEMQPQTQLQENLLSIFKETLHQAHIGLLDDYFLSGGDSLNAIQTISHIEELGYVLSVQDFYSHRTVEELASFLDDQNILKETSIIKKSPHQSIYPVSKLQQSIYTEQLLLNDTSYNMPGILHFDQDIHIEKLEEALNQLIVIYDIFKLSFEIDHFQLIQKKNDHIKISIERLSGQSLEEIRHQFIRPFDLQKAPLLRVGFWQENPTYILWDMHHIIMDGVSTPLLLNKLKEIYEKGSIEKPEWTYLDYVYNLESINKEKQLMYFRELLPKDYSKIQLWEDPNHIYEKKSVIYRSSVIFSKDVTNQIMTFTKEHHCSQASFFIGCLIHLLSVFDPHDKYIIGTVVSVRDHTYMQDMLGLLVNTLPLVIEYKAEIFDEVQNQMLNLLMNKDVTLEEIMSDLKMTNRQGNPWYDIMFSMRPFENQDFYFGNSKGRLIPFDGMQPKTSLSVEAFFEKQQLGCHFDFDASKYSKEVCDYYKRCFETYVKSVLEKSDHILSYQDHLILRDQPNRKIIPYMSYTINQLIDQEAYCHLQTPAVIAGDQTLTYQELIEKANACAYLLKQQGIQRGDGVALIYHRTALLLPIMIGILKAGAYYVLVSHDAPLERQKYMIQKSLSKLIVSDKTIQIDDIPCCVIQTLDNLESLQTEHSIDDIIYILFTSGSTGLPKGVVLKHRAITNLYYAMQERYDSQPGYVICSTNYIFDVFISESLFALANGKTVVLLDEEEMIMPWIIAKAIHQYQPDLIQFTPTRIAAYLENKDFYEALKYAKQMILVGEMLSVQTLHKIQQSGPIQILNYYGPTEAAVYVSYADLTHSATVHIGKPLGNCQMYIEDKNGDLQIPTLSGELLLSGECLAEKYIQDDEQTNQAFIQHPVIQKRVYKTGDLARVLLDGTIECLGRIDSQIKFNGHRIELEEIDASIINTQLVSEAATIAIRKDGVVLSLVCFIVKKQDGNIKEELLKTLQDYMIPSEFIPLTAIPKTATGKKDYHALENYYYDLQKQDVIETKDILTENDPLQKIWSEALQKSVRDDVHFFEQGGSSLTALMILTKYYELGYTMTVQDFYDHPTLQQQRDFLNMSKVASQGIFLSGVSGFLGVHILNELVNQTSLPIYCLVRNQQKAIDNIKYYLGEDNLNQYLQRIHFVCGDMTKEQFDLSQEDYNMLMKQIKIVIHSAGDVRHYSFDQSIEKTNVTGMKQMIQFAMASQATLHHISTLSICGDKVENQENICHFNEKCLDIGQNWKDNEYIKSKFISEQMIHEASLQGLDAHIYRVGHLVGRSTDGCFRIDKESQAVYRLMQGIQRIGYICESLLNQTIELTEVDLCAKAIVKLINAHQFVYHIANPYYLTVKECLPELAVVSDSQFMRQLMSCQHNNPYLGDVMDYYYRFQLHQDRMTIDYQMTILELEKVDFSWTKPNPAIMLAEFYQKREEINND